MHILVGLRVLRVLGIPVAQLILAILRNVVGILTEWVWLVVLVILGLQIITFKVADFINLAELESLLRLSILI